MPRLWSGAGGILQFSDFLGGPVGQSLGLAGPAPPTRSQEVGDWLHVKKGHDVATEGGAKIADEPGAGGDTGVAVLAIAGHDGDEGHDVGDMRLHNGQVRRRVLSITFQS